MLKGLLTMSAKELERLSVVQKIIDKRITQALGAEQLGLTIRQVKRLVRAYKQHGAQGLVSKQKGQVSNNKFSDKKIADIKKLVSTHYYDFGPKFATERLAEKHSIQVSKETLRQWMVDWGLWKAKRQKQAKIHPQRDRRDCFGELIQIDGSPHD